MEVIWVSYYYTDFLKKFTLALKLVIIQRVVLDKMQVATRNAQFYYVLIMANFYLF
jgi:hypothetical protein